MQTLRQINEVEAQAISDILDKELDTDFAVDPMVGQTFRRYIMSSAHAEWRLFLFAGIKFRTSPSGDRWYVDCYPEEEKPALRKKIDKANKRLAKLHG
jgi:hypothetical protein